MTRLRAHLDAVTLAIALLLMLCVSAALKGCRSSDQPAPYPLVAQGRAWIDAAVTEWHALGLAWTPRCDEWLGGMAVDRHIDRCVTTTWVCSEHGRIHVHPGVDAVHGAGASARAVIHEVGHLLVRCSELDAYGDTGHWLAIWEGAGPDSWAYRAQRRAMGGRSP